MAHDTTDHAVATSNNVGVPVSWTIMQPPPPNHQEAEAEHVREVPKLSIRVWINAEEDGIGIGMFQSKDIAAAVYKTGIFDFLEYQFREQIKATNATKS